MCPAQWYTAATANGASANSQAQGRLGRRSNSVYGGVLWRTDQRPEHRVVAGCEAGCMRFHLQRALQQIGLERGDRPLDDWGGHRATESRPTVTTRWAMRTTTRCARASSRPWSANCWSGVAFAATPRRAWPLQSVPAPLGAGLPVAGRVRGQPGEDGCMSTPGVEIHGAQRRHSAPLRRPRAGRHPNRPHCGPLRSLPPERGTLRDPLR